MMNSKDHSQDCECSAEMDQHHDESSDLLQAVLREFQLQGSPQLVSDSSNGPTSSKTMTTLQPAQVQELEFPQINSNADAFAAMKSADQQCAIEQTSFVKLLEQPEDTVRFRYPSEGRSGGSLCGVTSTEDRKTYPTIQIVGFSGPATCIVSLVESDPPFRAHPHSLINKDDPGQQDGICKVEINNEDMIYVFRGLGIQCVTKKGTKEALKIREKLGVDPFQQGFPKEKVNFNINKVRLCFQVTLNTPNGELRLDPVVSNIIVNERPPKILEYSDNESPAEGGRKILIFCEKFNKNDIEIHFMQNMKDGSQVISKGIFSQDDIYNQGISFKTPPFANPDISERHLCQMMLYKPESKKYSDPVEFWYNPSEIKTEQKVSLKRTKNETRPVEDSVSSGSIACPSKVNVSFSSFETAVRSDAPSFSHNDSLDFNVHPSLSNLNAFLQGNQQNCSSAYDQNYARETNDKDSLPILENISGELLLEDWDRLSNSLDSNLRISCDIVT